MYKSNAQAHTFASRTSLHTKPSLQKSVLFANAQPTDNISDRQKGQQITAVWQNGGFSAKFNNSSSIELLCKT